MSKLKVLAVGNGAGNALNTIVKSGNVELWAINTDKKVLNYAEHVNKLQIGKKLTNGLGGGGSPIIGEKAAEENASDISEIIRDTDTVITVACLGGGTASGATPVILEKISKETNANSLAIVTLPFKFEGNRKNQQAQEALEKIKQYADKVVVFDNNTILDSDKKMTLRDAFSVVDKIVSDLVNENL